MRSAAATGPSATGFDAQNIINGNIPYKSTGVGTTVQIEFPTDVLADTLILAGTNISFDATVTLLADGVSVGAIDVTRKGPAETDCFNTTGTPAPTVPGALINDVTQTGDGATTVYTVGGAAGLSVEEMQIFIDGVRQIPTTDYAVVDSGFDLVVTFTTAPPPSAVLHFYAATELLSGAGVEVNQTIPADGVSTVYTVTGGAAIIAEELEVFADGARLYPTLDFTVADSGGDLDVTFVNGAPGAGAVLYFYADYETSQARGGGARVSDATQTGDGFTVVYTVASAAGVTTPALEVFLDGVRQRANVDYTVVSLGTSLSVTFLTAPSVGSEILFYADSEITAAVGFTNTSDDWPRRNIVAFFPDVTAQVWTLTINDPNNRDGQIRIFRAIIDTERSAEHVQDGWSISTTAILGKPSRTISGALINRGGELFRIMRLKTTLLSDSSAYAEMRRDLALGYDQELFVVLCPDDAAMIESTSFLGKPVDIPTTQARRAFSLFSRPLVLEEVF